MSDVSVKFSAEDQNLSKTVRDIQKDLERLDAKSKDASKGFDMSFGKLGIAAGVAGAAVKAGMMAVETATAAASAIVSGFGEAIDLGGQLTDLSSRTGESAGNLLVLQRAFDNTGVGADKVGGSINKLQKFMAEASAGGEDQKATMNALGISMSDLAGKTPTEQMQVFATKISGITDPTERARAAMEVFGKSGGELLPLLNDFDAEIDGAKSQLGSMPDVMNRSAGAMDQLGDNFAAIKKKTMEFAAGFIETALPALNAFVSSLTGVDSAGWGESLMKRVMSVADFLIGAFKAPMPAIEAIGATLDTGIRIAGNNFLNSLVDAARFLSAFFSSDLPGVIAGVLGNTLVKNFIDSTKFFLDGLNSVVKAFEGWFGDAIQNIVDFFTTKFSGVLNAVAQDFKSAMQDPVGFVTGKLDSALMAVMENGGDTFQTSFEKAGGSTLEKISEGLGAVSKEYSDKIVDGTARVKGEFDKIVAGIEPSAKDFFGAEPAAAAAAAKLKDVESVGVNLRKEFEKSTESANAVGEKVSGAVVDAESIAGSFNKAAGSTQKIKEDLSLSEKLLKDISEAEKKAMSDPGGKLSKKSQDQISRGDFEGARQTAKQMENNDIMSSIRGIGKGMDRRNLYDIGKDFGLSPNLGELSMDFAKRIKSAKENAAGSVDKPGQDGLNEKSTKKNDSELLYNLVQKVLDVVQKIEPKLPVASLSI